MAYEVEKGSFAVITGASSGIGRELARCCAQAGFDLLIAADEDAIHSVAEELGSTGVKVEALVADLATSNGVDALVTAIGTRPVSALLANAGRGLGHSFLEQDLQDIDDVIATNVTGTVRLLHKVGRSMRARGAGKILITGSIAGLMPGSYQAVYNATKAFLDSFSYALRDELKDTGVTVSVLMPGATDTRFFERAGMLNTEVGQAKKDDPAMVAKTGFAAMMDEDGGVVAGLKNKLQAAATRIIPDEMLAAQHRKMAQPKSS